MYVLDGKNYNPMELLLTLNYINQIKNDKDFFFFAYISGNNNSLIGGIFCRASWVMWFFTTNLDVKQNYKLDYKLAL